MNNRWKDMINTLPSQMALLLLFSGLVIGKISGVMGWDNIEIAGYLTAGIVVALWLAWGTYFFVSKIQMAIVPVRYRFFIETFCNLLYMVYVYMIDGLISVVVFMPLIIMVQWNIIKETKEEQIN